MQEDFFLKPVHSEPFSFMLVSPSVLRNEIWCVPRKLDSFYVSCGPFVVFRAFPEPVERADTSKSLMFPKGYVVKFFLHPQGRTRNDKLFGLLASPSNLDNP